MVIKEKMGLENFGSVEMIKIVADIENGSLSAGCELHIDCADELSQNGSESKYLWGANVYPKNKKIDFISLINIRPQANNRSMEIQSEEIKQKVKNIIEKFLF